MYEVGLNLMVEEIYEFCNRIHTKRKRKTQNCKLGILELIKCTSAYIQQFFTLKTILKPFCDNYSKF